MTFHLECYQRQGCVAVYMCIWQCWTINAPQSAFQLFENLMPESPVIALSFDASGVRTNRDVVAGAINLNLDLAVTKEVEVVRISLRGEVNT